MPIRYKIFFSENTWGQIQRYKRNLIADLENPGNYLREKLRLAEVNGQNPLQNMSDLDFLRCLLSTKLPVMFSDVDFSITNWTSTEVGLLGNIMVDMPVTIFDDGNRGPVGPTVHAEPFTGHLIFVPGLLLTQGSPDHAAVVDLGVDNAVVSSAGGRINPEDYYNLIKERLLPALLVINKEAGEAGNRAFVECPGLGCGVFAGEFDVAPVLRASLTRLLREHAHELRNIAAIRLDLFRNGITSIERISGMDFLVADSSVDHHPQLTEPGVINPDYADCELYKIVAADHLSLPCNAFNGDSAYTDEGRTAASTSAETVITDQEGRYDNVAKQYLRADGGGWQSFYAANTQFQLQVNGDNVFMTRENAEVVPVATRFFAAAASSSKAVFAVSRSEEERDVASTYRP